MNFLKLGLMLIVLTYSVSSNSRQWSPSSNIKVTYVHNAHGGYGVYQLDDMSTNPSNCTSPVYFVLSKASNPVFDEIYALMLTAHISGKKVQVWTSGCSPHNHMEIQHARVVN
jgi:hypothetical protein